MLRTFSWKWLGITALVLSPAVVYGQGSNAQSHTVRQGDTLWGLAKQYRGDPFLWPDLYRMNTAVVEDPHWIYPGEVLRLSGTETLAAVPAVDTPAPAAAPVDSTTQMPDSASQTADTLPPAAAPSAPASSDASVQPEAEPTSEVPDVAAPPAHQATLAELAQAPVGEEPEPLFGPKPPSTLQETILAYTKKDYRPLRRSEFYSSGFLTENENLPWAKVIGPVTPSQIGSPIINDAMPFTTIAIEPPHGATYQIGDTPAARTAWSGAEAVRQRRAPHRPGPDQRYRVRTLHRDRRGGVCPDSSGTGCTAGREVHARLGQRERCP